MPSVVQPVDFLPGIQRDGTMLDANRAVDSLWTRWRLGRPRKMRGYKNIAGALGGLARNMHAYYSGTSVYIHVGTTNGIQQFVTDLYGNLISSADRTPSGSSFNGANTDWTLDSMFDTVSGTVRLVAHASANAGSVAATTATTPLIGPLLTSSQLSAFSDPGAYGGGSWLLPTMAGGIVCVHPFVFAFDVSGRIFWSGPNQPLTLGIIGGNTGAGQIYGSSQKIIAGIPVRGGGTQQPAAIFHSLSEIIFVSYVGSTAGYFGFNTLSTSTSILSAKTLIEHDGLVYWAARDRFLMYNGTVVEVPNTQNQDWFFDNITPGTEGKAFAVKVPRYGEIWFCAALFGATECSHACIFNVREQAWYDTVLPNGGRTAGRSAQGLPFTVMGGLTQGTSGYKLWLHETGLDEVDGNLINPVRSYYETPWFGAQKSNPPVDRGMSIQQLEPDFIQTGDLSVSVIGTANSRAPVNVGSAKPILFSPTVPQEQLVSFKESHRMTRLHVESNVVGGNYISGHNLLHVLPADSRVTGG